MEVDEEGQERGRLAVPKRFFLGTPKFNQRQQGEGGKRSICQSANSMPMDISLQEPTLPTVAPPQVLGPSSSVPKPFDPLMNRMTQGANQVDAMAIRVENISQLKEKEKEQYKAVLKQKDDELGQAKERFQRDLDQSKADHQEHFKRMESNINEVAANHETQNQRSQRNLELRTQ